MCWIKKISQGYSNEALRMSHSSNIVEQDMPDVIKNTVALR